MVLENVADVDDRDAMFRGVSTGGVLRPRSRRRSPNTYQDPAMEPKANSPATSVAKGR